MEAGDPPQQQALGAFHLNSPPCYVAYDSGMIIFIMDIVYSYEFDTILLNHVSERYHPILSNSMFHGDIKFLL